MSPTVSWLMSSGLGRIKTFMSCKVDRLLLQLNKLFMDMEDVENLINGNDWYLFERIPKSPLWFAWSPLMGYVRELDNLHDTGCFKGVYVFDEGSLHMYKVEDEFKKAGQELIKEGDRKYSEVSGILDNIESLSNELITHSRNLRSIDVQAAYDKKLSELFHEAYKVHEELWVEGQAINLLEHGHSLLGGELNRLLLEEGVEDSEIPQVFEKITKPERYSFLQKEEQDLIRLVKEGINEDALEKHWEQYAWLGYNWIGPGYEKKYFEDRAQDLKGKELDEKLQSEEVYRKDVKEARKDMLERYYFSEEIRRLSNLLRSITFLKSLRVDASWMFYWAMEPIFSKVAKDNYMSVEQVKYLTPDEITDLLRGRSIDESKANRRKRMSAFVFEEGNLRELDSEKARKAFELLQTETSVDEDVNEVTGDTGSPGTAQGVVKIVDTPEEMSKTEDGNVLVSHATSPRLVPAMKKASAVVSEVGGVTSHAAIVSRELETPCVIGITNATKLLEDGDSVMVDADEGVVKIVEE